MFLLSSKKILKSSTINELLNYKKKQLNLVNFTKKSRDDRGIFFAIASVAVNFFSVTRMFSLAASVADTSPRSSKLATVYNLESLSRDFLAII